MHWSPIVHLSPSLHGVPSSLAGSLHTPVCASQTPTSWHWSLATHTTAVPPHTPPVHLSPVVHLRLSSQTVLSALVGFEHKLVFTSHTPASWHWSCARQVMREQHSFSASSLLRGLGAPAV